MSGTAKCAALSMLMFQILFIILLAIFARHEDSADGHSKTANSTAEPSFPKVYPKFQEVNVMVFIGIGFLIQFLKRYGFSSIGFNLLLGALCVQWATAVHGVGEIITEHENTFPLNMEKVLVSEFAAVTVLISFGVVIGKTNLSQLVVMAIAEVIFQHVNEKILLDHFMIADIGGSMGIHLFAAFFGLAVSRVLHTGDIERSTKEASDYHNDLFAFIGTGFLWVYWPSFNAALLSGVREERTVINSFYAMCACAVTVFAISMILHRNAVFDAQTVENATLAGGVTVGASADLFIEPFGAILIGVIAGVISTIGFKFIGPYLATRWKLHDTCGVNNLHGITGLTAAIISAIVGSVATEDQYGSSLSAIYGARPHRSASAQAGFQILGLALTIAISIFSGLLTGYLMNFSSYVIPSGEELFDDDVHWQVPLEGLPHAKPFKKDKNMLNLEKGLIRRASRGSISRQSFQARKESLKLLTDQAN